MMTKIDVKCDLCRSVVASVEWLDGVIKFDLIEGPRGHLCDACAKNKDTAEKMAIETKLALYKEMLGTETPTPMDFVIALKKIHEKII